MPDRLYFSGIDEADALIARDPLALLIGFVLDQQVTVQKAFAGPLVLEQRAGTLDAAALAAMDLEPIFRERPALHRFPGAMAGRVQALCEQIARDYDGHAERVWTEASSADDLRTRLGALPGFGAMKVKAVAAVLSKHFGVATADALVPDMPTLGDVDSPAALAEYQAGKRAQKAARRAERAAASTG
jgi:uncharacterized HhH-GPD family protein